MHVYAHSEISICHAPSSGSASAILNTTDTSFKLSCIVMQSSMFLNTLPMFSLSPSGFSLTLQTALKIKAIRRVTPCLTKKCLAVMLRPSHQAQM